MSSGTERNVYFCVLESILQYSDLKEIMQTNNCNLSCNILSYSQALAHTHSHNTLYVLTQHSPAHSPLHTCPPTPSCVLAQKHSPSHGLTCTLLCTALHSHFLSFFSLILSHSRAFIKVYEYIFIYSNNSLPYLSTCWFQIL